ncbi:MAG: hypothetical protein KF784_04375 [Fimbriimonadaceae bacterium]|nr:hypothetical protein [Fimbriimonadaceae bacterium]
MRTLLLIGVMSALALGQKAPMDTSIGAKSADDYHQSVFDPKQKLYLFSGAD